MYSNKEFNTTKDKPDPDSSCEDKLCSRILLTCLFRGEDTGVTRSLTHDVVELSGVTNSDCLIGYGTAPLLYMRDLGYFPGRIHENNMIWPLGITVHH